MLKQPARFQPHKILSKWLKPNKTQKLTSKHAEAQKKKKISGHSKYGRNQLKEKK